MKFFKVNFSIRVPVGLLGLAIKINFVLFVIKDKKFCKLWQ
jgi:hypothetical protein